MNIHANKKQKNKSQSIAKVVSQKKSGNESTFQFIDNRSETKAQRKLQELANNSPQAIQQKSTCSETIQRAVGFEFQTGWQAYMDVPIPNGTTVPISFPKETALYGGRGD